MTAHANDWTGSRLGGGRYEVLGKLGEGGMGAVYRAHDRNLDTDVVIKVPHPQMLRDPEFAARFAREIRSLVQLAHPHVVKILDVGEHEGVPYAVMQFLPGGSLEDRRLQGPAGRPLPMSPQEIAEWVENVADALDFIHKQGWLHRDIKPGNILFDAHGNVFLSDFGVAKAIAKDAENPQSSQLTGTGMVLGTPDYMAPEVVLGTPSDGRSDQYALAVALFELLSGRLPFVGPNPTAVLVAHSTQPVPDLRSVCAQVPGGVACVVQRGLAKDPAQRYPTCKAFAVAFTGAVHQPGAAAQETVFRHHCPACKQVLRVAEKAAGQRVPCPGCKTQLQISADRQQVTLAGPRRTPLRTAVAVAAPLETSKIGQPSAGTTPPPLPIPAPGARPAKRPTPLAAYVGSAILALAAVVAIALWVGRSPQPVMVAEPNPEGLEASKPKAKAAEPKPAEPAAKPHPEPEPLQQPSVVPPPAAKAKPAPPTEPEATLKPEPKPEAKAEPKVTKLPAPLGAEQLQIAQRLDRQYSFGSAKASAEKMALAKTLFDAAAVQAVTPAERFVLWRLAKELAESAGMAANTPIQKLLEHFDVNLLDLSPPLLSQWKPVDPVVQLIAEALQLMAAEKDREAAVKLDEASRMAPNDQRSQYVMGLLQYKSNNFSKARELFTNCSTSDGSDLRIRAYNALALSCLWEGKLPQAVESFGEAVKLSKPNTPAEVAQNLGRLSHFKSNPDTPQAKLVWKDARLTTAFNRLCKETNAASSFDPGRGWLIMPLLDAVGKPLGDVGLERFEDRRCHACAGRGCLRCRRTRIEFSLIRPEDIRTAQEAGLIPGQPPMRPAVGHPQAPGGVGQPPMQPQVPGALGQPQDPTAPGQPKQ